MARPREAVGCRTLICRKADGPMNDLATYNQLTLRNAPALRLGESSTYCDMVLSVARRSDG